MSNVNWVIFTLVIREFADLLIIHNLFTLRLILLPQLRMRRWIDCLIVYFFVSAVAQLLFDLVNPPTAALWVMTAGTPALVIVALTLMRANRGISRIN